MAKKLQEVAKAKHAGGQAKGNKNAHKKTVAVVEAEKEETTPVAAAPPASKNANKKAKKRAAAAAEAEHQAKKPKTPEPVVVEQPKNAKKAKKQAAVVPDVVKVPAKVEQSTKTTQKPAAVVEPVDDEADSEDDDESDDEDEVLDDADDFETDDEAVDEADEDEEVDEADEADEQAEDDDEESDDETAAKPPSKPKAVTAADQLDADVDDENEKVAVDLKKSKKTKAGVCVFVGNLPNNIKRTQLMKLFAPFAKVQAVRFRRGDGGQLFNVKTSTLKCIIAFVDVPTEAEAQAAVAGLNGIEVRDHVLRVNLQRDAKNAGFMDEKRTICAGNLAYDITDDLLRETFECCGEIEYVRTIQGPQGCKGIGFVCFAEAASVPMAFELNNGMLGSRPIRVTRYSAHKKPAEGKPSKRHQTFGAQRRMAKKLETSGGRKLKVASVIRQNIANDVANKRGSKHHQSPAGGAGNKKSKREFSGAKVADKKNKGKKGQKKGGLKGPKLLAKKIAPRE